MFNKINILAILLVSFNLPTANASLDKEYSGATIRYYGTSYSAKLKDSSVKEEPATKIDNCSNGNPQITRAELDAMIANSEDVTGVCTSGIKDMSYLFAADNLTQTHLTTFNQDISNWNTSNVENMEWMFYQAENFNQDLSSWDTSKVKNFSHMFRNAYRFNNGGMPLAKFVTSNADDTSWMFKKALNFNQDISNWDTSNVVNFEFMFEEANNFNQDINSWDTSKVKSFKYMFRYAEAFNTSISDWNLSNAETMFGMFTRSIYNKPLDNWVFPNGVKLDQMFYSNSVFNQPLDMWDMTPVSGVSSMFHYASSFNQDLTSWDLASVIPMTAKAKQSFASDSGLEAKNMPTLP